MTRKLRVLLLGAATLTHRSPERREFNLSVAEPHFQVKYWQTNSAHSKKTKQWEAWTFPYEGTWCDFHGNEGAKWIHCVKRPESGVSCTWARPEKTFWQQGLWSKGVVYSMSKWAPPPPSCSDLLELLAKGFCIRVISDGSVWLVASGLLVLLLHFRVIVLLPPYTRDLICTLFYLPGRNFQVAVKESFLWRLCSWGGLKVFEVSLWTLKLRSSLPGSNIMVAAEWLQCGEKSGRACFWAYSKLKIKGTHFVPKLPIKLNA